MISVTPLGANRNALCEGKKHRPINLGARYEVTPVFHRSQFLNPDFTSYPQTNLIVVSFLALEAFVQ
jgi:hypothetical protein